MVSNHEKNRLPDNGQLCHRIGYNDRTSSSGFGGNHDEAMQRAGMGLGVDTALLLRGYGFLEEAQVFDKLASIRRRIENLQKLHSH